MKSFTSLGEARRSLIIQVGVLFSLILLICLGGRFLAKNRFNTTLILDFEKREWNPDDLKMKWNEEEIRLTDIKVGFEEEHYAPEAVRSTVLSLNMEPQKPGKYELSIFDPEGNHLISDTIHVSRMGTSVSEATGSFTGDEAVFLAAILFYLGLAVIMLVFFLRLRGPLMNSYEAILAVGVLAFSVFTIILEVPFYIRHLQNPAYYTIWALLNDLGAGGKYFMFFTSPLVALFSVLLMISNIELLRHEPPRFRNILGLLLGAFLLGGEILYIFRLSFIYNGTREGFRLLTTAENIFGIVFSYIECILLASIICGVRAARHVPEPDRDYILILGCGFRKDGTLFPLLRGRVDKAMEFWYRQKELTGKEAVIIPSGGQGKDETMAESEAMQRYMLSTGFPEHAVIQENRSANTYQNMEFSRKIIEERAGCSSPPKVAYVTTNYHVFRSGVWAGLAGLPAEGLGSRTKWWFWPNAFVRECVGLLHNRIIPELVFLLILVLFFGWFSYFTTGLFGA